MENDIDMANKTNKRRLCQPSHRLHIHVYSMRAYLFDRNFARFTLCMLNLRNEEEGKK